MTAKSNTNSINRAALLHEIESEKPARSAWDRGVQAAAYEIVDSLEHLDSLPADYGGFKDAMLSGAKDWDTYSYGGRALIYDADIAERYCSPSELKRVRGGERRPNSREDWLDVQARALRQAFSHVWRASQRLTA